MKISMVNNDGDYPSQIENEPTRPTSQFSHESSSVPVNCSRPNNLTNNAFMTTVRIELKIKDI